MCPVCVALLRNVPLSHPSVDSPNADVADDDSAERAPTGRPKPDQKAVIILSTMKLLLHFLIAWQARNRISARAMNPLFHMLGRTFAMGIGLHSTAVRDALAARGGTVWPKHTIAAAKTLGIDTNRFELMAFCPNPICGCVYTLKEARTIIKCRRFVSNSMEQPVATYNEKHALLQEKLQQSSANDTPAMKKEVAQCGKMLLKRLARRPSALNPK